MSERDLEFDSTGEIEAYQREIQLLLNIVEPDPEFQASFIGDAASLFDCVGTDEEIMLSRLKEYFGSSFDFQLNTPLPELVQLLNNAYLGWPDEPFVPAYETQSNTLQPTQKPRG